MEAKYGNLEEGEENSESDETEDDDGELATADVDAKIFEAIEMLRSKTADVYNPNVKFFNDEVDGAGTKAKTREKVRWLDWAAILIDKPLRLKDYHRNNLLDHRNGGMESEDKDGNNEVPINLQGMNRLIDDFKEAAGSSDEEFDLRAKNKIKKGKVEKKAELKYEIRPDENPEAEKFLQNYLSQQGWRNADGLTLEEQARALEEEDSEASEEAEEFEVKYNFRFENPSATVVTTHARDVPASLRRPAKSGRQHQRETKRLELEGQMQKEEEEIKRLRNLKRREFDRKLSKVHDVAGFKDAAKVFIETDLNEDFNEAEWDSRMAKIFGNDYYHQEVDSKKPKFDEDVDISDIVPNEDAQIEQEEEPTMSKRQTKVHNAKRKAAVDALVEEAYPQSSTARQQLQRVRGSKSSGFPYREVSPDAYGLYTEEILFTPDLLLNEFISVKKMAPYREDEKKAKTKRLTRRQKLWEWRKKVSDAAKEEKKARRQAREREEAEDVEIAVE